MNPMRYSASYELNTEMILTEENRRVASLFWEQENLGPKVLVCNPFLGGSTKNLRDEEYGRILKICYWKKRNWKLS